MHTSRSLSIKFDPLAYLPTAAVALIVGAFVWILMDLIVGGIGQLDLAFLLSSPSDAGRSGGIAPIIVSTLAIIAVCIVVAAPVGVATAALLAEYTRDGQRFAQTVRTSLDVLAGVPSIVFGLFGNAFFCVVLGLGYSILSGGLTLACMALPLVIRASEEGFRAIPNDVRLAAAASGLRPADTLIHVLLPAARPGILVGMVLGIGRALAETAALLFTSGYVDRMPSSVMDSGRALSVHIYDLSMNVAGGEPRAKATALVLIALLMAVNAVSAWIGGRFMADR